VLDLVATAPQTLVLDADALNALAENRQALSQVAQRGSRVLTPHPGEMARLAGRRTAEVQADRRGLAVAAAREWGAVVVLKGSHTVVAAPDGRLSEDPHEVPALATGGTGDVLAGVIAGLVAQGSEPFEAAVTGVYVHAEAGRRIAGRLGDSGLLASDLLLEVPLVMRALREAPGVLGL
jgi:NAD(P)H-hydrate epimerase